MGAGTHLIFVAVIFASVAALPLRGPLNIEQRRTAKFRMKSRFNSSKDMKRITRDMKSFREATCECNDPMSYLEGKNTYYCSDGTSGQCGVDEICYGRTRFMINDLPSGCKARDYNVWIEEQYFTCSDEHLIVKLENVPLEDCTGRCDRTPPCQYVFGAETTCSTYTACQQKRIPTTPGTTLVKIPIVERPPTPQPTESPTPAPTSAPTTSPTPYTDPLVDRLQRPPLLLAWIIPVSVMLPLASVWCGAGLHEKIMS